MTDSEQNRAAASAASEEEPFWRRKPLAAMSEAEWESLCDGCGKCCLEKLEDWETGELAFTNIACRLLNVKNGRCRQYAERFRFVPDCRRLTPGNVRTLKWLPSTCAYRLLAAGEDLPWWHPLVSGDPHTVHLAGQSVRGRCIPAAAAGDPERHIVDWAS
jgi:uncharacterized cysteine cluster protein YcgN (CxxCxxCC family)